MSRRRMEVNLHDAHLGLWQKDPNDPTLKSEIFDGLLRHLKRRGFKITADPDVAKRFRILSPRHRIAARGDMRAEIQVNGCCVQIDWWSEAAPEDNPNGRKYDFGRLKRMPYLDRLRFELEIRHILAWLSERAELADKPKGRVDVRPGINRGEVSAAEYIRLEYATCWHTDKELGRPKASDSNRRSKDGSLIDQGARVWFIDRKGRVNAGTAFYSLNDRWMIATSAHTIEWASGFEIYARCPTDLRTKRNERARRKRLEGELAKAITRMNFPRAEVLRKILFGNELTYGIWATDNNAYYRSNYSGYTTDRIAAGRYTWDEAAKEVRCAPSELRLVLPDGRHLKAHELDRPRVA